jgi:hypothetical protein
VCRHTRAEVDRQDVRVLDVVPTRLPEARLPPMGLTRSGRAGGTVVVNYPAAMPGRSERPLTSMLAAQQ